MAFIPDPSIVRICSKDGKLIFGAGFLVGEKWVVSCAHVIKSLLEKSNSSSSQPEDTIYLDFPLVDAGKIKEANVIFWKTEEEEDIAFLKLNDEPPKKAMPAKLVTSDDLWNHSVRAYGFPKGFNKGVWAKGELRSKIDNEWVQLDNFKIFGHDVVKGFSGTPIWDDNLRGVVGMLIATETPDNNSAYFASVEFIEKSWLEFSKENNELSRSVFSIKKYSFHRPPIFQVPPLPGHFVERPEITEKIKNSLLDDNLSKYGLVISAIHGMGGIGKTTLASFLAHDPDVLERFPDGVLWVTLGQNPNLLSLLSNWVQDLGDYKFKPISIENTSNHLRALLKEKSFLLVIDDAWKPSDVECFKVGGSNCRMLITTRKSVIASFLGADLLKLSKMTEPQALKLLSRRLRKYFEGNEKKQAKALAKQVGYHPQALELATEQLKYRKFNWSELLKDLKHEFNRLKALEMPGVEELNEEQKRKLSLLTSLNLSLRELGHERLKDFAWIGVLPEDIVLNPKMAAKLWNVDENTAEKNLIYLESKSLLLPEFRVHDFMHEIAHKLIKAPVNPKEELDFPGLGLELQKAHEKFLKRYKEKIKDGCWHTLDDDGYICNHLVWHMDKAGWVEEIHSLLKEENPKGKNGWYEKRESLGQTAGFIEDVSHAWSLAEKESNLGLEIRYALTNSSINSLSSNIPPNLMVSLLENKVWTEFQAYAYTQKETDPSKKVMKLISLYPIIKDRAVKSKLPKEVLYLTSKIQNELERENFFSSVFSWFFEMEDQELLSKGIDLVSEIKDEKTREKILLFVASHLPKIEDQKLFPQIMDSASHIQNTQTRAKIIVSIASHLSGTEKEKVLEEALYLASKIKYEQTRADVLIFIVSHISLTGNDELYFKVLDLASEIQYEEIRVDVFISVLSQLSEIENRELIYKILNLNSNIQNYKDRLRLLVSVASNLFGTEKEKVLEDALNLVAKTLQKKKSLSSFYEIEYENTLANDIICITSNFSGTENVDLYFEVLGLASKIKDESILVRVLTSVVPQFSKTEDVELFSKIIALTSKIQDEENRMKILISIVSRLSGIEKEKMLKEVLDLASEANKPIRMKILISIASHLSGAEKEKVLREALGLAYEAEESNRVKILISIISHLSVKENHELFSKILDLTSRLQLEEERIEILLFISFHFSMMSDLKLLSETLALTSKIQDERTRTEVLISIASSLSGSIKKKVLNEALDSIAKIQNEQIRIDLLTSISSHLSGTEKKKVLEEILVLVSKIQDELNCIKAMSSVTSYLSGKEKEKWLKEVLSLASKIRDGFKLANAIPCIASNLSEADAEELFNETLNLAFKIHNEWFFIDAICTVISELPENKSTELTTEALKMTSKIQNEQNCAKLLSTIASKCHGPRKEEILTNILTLTSNIRLRENQLSVFISVASQISGNENQKLLKELLNSTNQWHHRDRLIFLFYLFPHLSGQEKEATLNEFFNLTSKYQSERYRARILSSFASHLSGPEKENVLKKALDLASNIQDNFKRAEILTAISYNLPEIHRDKILSEALDLIINCSEQNRASIINSVVSQVYGTSNEVILKKSLYLASNIQDESKRVDILVSIISCLTGKENEGLLKEALYLSPNIQDELKRIRLLSSIGSHLFEIENKELLTGFINIASEIQSKGNRALVLTSVVSCLSEVERNKISNEVVKLANEVQNKKIRAKIMSSIASHFCGAEREKLLNESLDLASEIQDEVESTIVISCVCFHLQELPFNTLYLFLRRILQILATHTRKSFLDSIESLIPIVYMLSNEKGLTETCDSIKDASSWWP